MRSLPYLAIALLVSVAELAAAEDPPQNTIREPLTAMERSATARLTRLHSARLWWNDDNRAMGASFKGSDANDASIRLVSRLPGLRTLVIVAPPENNLTDHGLAPLANLPNLELLSISGDRIGDEGLVHIQQLPKLRTLVLNCNVSDAGLEMICHLSNLEQLDLTQIACHRFRARLPPQFAEAQYVDPERNTDSRRRTGADRRIENGATTLPRQHRH